MNPIISEVEHDILQTVIFHSKQEDYVKRRLGKKVLVAKNLAKDLQKLRIEFNEMKHPDSVFIQKVVEIIDQSTQEASG